MAITGDAGVEGALRRVALGFRIAGAVWLCLLAVVVLTTGVPVARPLVVVLTVLLAAAWTAVTLLLARRTTLRSWFWLAADLGVAAWTVAGPLLIGATQATFAGGYPFSAVVLAVWTRGLPGGLLAAAVLSAATLARLLRVGPSVDEAVENVVFYLATAAILDWSIGVLRRNEARRREAEAALVRSQERAETAAHLHDSVLQTLALIQRRGGDNAEASLLARRQERELRDWLYGGPGTPGATVGDALARTVEELEERYAVTIELVVVGDAALDERGEALVAAAREALVNAATHAGVDRVSVYAESDPAATRVFVRDRGAGFDTDAVGDDRRGLRESIVGRLRRHGGSATVRSRPGQGTEVAMEVPRGVP